MYSSQCFREEIHIGIHSEIHIEIHIRTPLHIKKHIHQHYETKLDSSQKECIFCEKCTSNRIDAACASWKCAICACHYCYASCWFEEREREREREREIILFEGFTSLYYLCLLRAFIFYTAYPVGWIFSGRMEMEMLTGFVPLKMTRQNVSYPICFVPVIFYETVKRFVPLKSTMQNVWYPGAVTQDMFRTSERIHLAGYAV